MENADFNSILNALAENPGTLRKLVSAVGDAPPRPAYGRGEEAPDLPREIGLPDKTGGAEQNRDIENLIRLLSALKPYLDSDKRGKIDGAIRILRIVSLASGAGLIGGERRD